MKSSDEVMLEMLLDAIQNILDGNEPSDEAVEVLKNHAAKKIGAIAKPKKILFVVRVGTMGKVFAPRATLTAPIVSILNH